MADDGAGMMVHSIAFYRDDGSGYESPKAGTSQGIFFSNFIPTLVRAHAAAFPGWQLRVHHDERVVGLPVFEQLALAPFVKLVNCGESRALCRSMLWRLGPIFDPDVDWFICRDVDSLPMHRDRLMCEEAIQAGASAHAILDSESHCGPLMGGMCGFKPADIREAFPEIRNLDGLLALAPFIDLKIHGSDQMFLNHIIYPRVAGRTLIHQRRPDIVYRDAMATMQVAPQMTELDKVIRHIGAAYSLEKAQEALA